MANKNRFIPSFEIHGYSTLNAVKKKGFTLHRILELSETSSIIIPHFVSLAKFLLNYTYTQC